jgi:hypothetical protein
MKLASFDRGCSFCGKPRAPGREIIEHYDHARAAICTECVSAAVSFVAVRRRREDEAETSAARDFLADLESTKPTPPKGCA